MKIEYNVYQSLFVCTPPASEGSEAYITNRENSSVIIHHSPSTIQLQFLLY